MGLPATATNMIGPLSRSNLHCAVWSGGFGIASRLEGLVVIPLFALSASIGPSSARTGALGFSYKRSNASHLPMVTLVGSGRGRFALLATVSADSPIRLTPSRLDVAADYLVILPISYGVWGIIMMTSAIFNALGHPLRSTILSIARMFLIYHSLTSSALG